MVGPSMSYRHCDVVRICCSSTVPLSLCIRVCPVSCLFHVSGSGRMVMVRIDVTVVVIDAVVDVSAFNEVSKL